MSLQGQITIGFSRIAYDTSMGSKKSKLAAAHSYSIPCSSLNRALHETEFFLNVDGEMNWQLQLHESKSLLDNHQVYVYTDSQEKRLAPYDPLSVRQYSGSIVGNSSSRVSLTVSQNAIEGLIFDGSTTYYVERAQPDNSENDIQHIVYTEQDVLDKTIHCLSNEANAIKHHSSNQSKKTTNSCIEISLAIAVDYDYYQIYNWDISTVIARSLAVMNAVAIDFESQFQETITFKIVEHYISTCDACDPWGDNQDVLVLLENFSHWAEEGGFSQAYDLGQLWTGGDLQLDQSSNVIGYAFKGGLCSNKKYHVLEDFSESLWKLRFLTSHEIGHNLNCSHDPVGSSSIMSPTVTNTSNWSANSTSAVNSFLNAISCLSNCSTTYCEPVSNLNINDFSTSMLSLSWSGSQRVLVKLVDTETNETLFETFTNNNTLDIPGEFSACQNLLLELQVDCIQALSEVLRIPLGNPHPLAIDVLDIKSFDCIPGATPSYNIQLVINHNGTIGDPFFVEIDGQTTRYVFDVSPQTIVIDRDQILNPTSAQNLQIFSIIDSKLYCLSEETLQNIPNQDCDLFVLEDFNDCKLPYGWTKTSSNTTYFPFQYTWQFDDNSRKILNYAKGENETAEKTISGNCMAYFDDDINSNMEYTGSVFLDSEVYDISDYTNVSLNFTYIFHDFSDIKGSNNSFFSFQIWSNNVWVEVLRKSSSPCSWSNVWRPECMNFFSLSVDAYSSDLLRCRFLYSDNNEGDWTGMIGLDNFSIRGTRQITVGCTASESINYNPLANQDDGSCYSCQNGIQDGLETGVDCGGQDCPACIVPCAKPKELITSIVKDTIFTDVDEIQISATIDQFNVGIKPGSSALFLAGFNIKRGSILNTEIQPCVQ